jgi:hypothetical protein
MLSRADLAATLMAAVERPAARDKTFALLNQPGAPPGRLGSLLRGAHDPRRRGRLVSRLPEAQHAWKATFAADDEGRPVAPRFHRLLMLEVAGTPTAAEHLETALRELQRGFAYGPAGLSPASAGAPAGSSATPRSPGPVARSLPLARWENPAPGRHRRVPAPRRRRRGAPRRDHR